MLSPAERHSLAQDTLQFNLQSRRQGTDCLINGLVQLVECHGNRITAVVADDESCKVSWKLDGAVWKNQCSCTVHSNCKHAYAVAHHVLQHGVEGGAGTEEKRSKAGAFARSIENTIDRLVSLVSAEKKEESPRSSRKSLVTQFLEARNTWDAVQVIGPLCEQLGLKSNVASNQWFSMLEGQKLEKRAWLLARHISKLGGRLPPELEPHRHYKEFEKEETRSKEEAWVSSIQEWMALMPSHALKPERSIRVVWSWDAAPASGEGPAIQLLLSSKKLKDAPRTPQQIRTFAVEATRSPQRFNAEDSDFLRWLNAQFHLLADPHQSATQENATFISQGRALHAWLSAWGRVERCVWKDGTPVKYERTVASIVPVFQSPRASQEGGTEKQSPVSLDFSIHVPGVGTFPLQEARLVFPPAGSEGREPTFAFVNQAFYLVQNAPPASVLVPFLKGEALKLTSSRRTALLPGLLRRFPRLADQSAGLVCQHPVQTIFSMNLNPTDWLCVRLYALSRDSNHRWEYVSDGWMLQKLTHEGFWADRDATRHGPVEGSKKVHVQNICLEAPEAQAPTAPLEPSQSNGQHLEHVPKFSETALAQEWMDTLGLETALQAGLEEDHGWWVYLDSRRIEQLLEQWAARPKSTEFWANPAFRSLVTPSHHAAGRLKIRSSGMDWFTISADWDSMELKLTSADAQILESSQEKFVKLSSGRWINREEGQELQKTAQTVAEVGLDLFSGEEQRITPWQFVHANAESVQQLISMLEDGATEEARDALLELKGKLAGFQGLPEVTIPSRLRAEMRGYQVEGLKFLSYASSLQLGAILADDMGLGKTLQALAWMESLRDAEGSSPCLVVCPASVVYNWQREAEKFVDGSKILLLTSGEARHELRREIPGYDLVITNYALLRRDLDELKQFQFRAVILDEAQNIKNPDSQVAQAAKQLKAHHRLALTGTPLENRLLDLWSIVDFVAPGYLGKRGQFVELYDNPEHPQRRKQLASRLRPILLRRIKKEVAPDLPDRIEEKRDCELTEEQRVLYVSELKRAREMVLNLEDGPAFAQKKIHVLAALTRLRQICCHPSLIGGQGVSGSGKTMALMDILEPLIAGGHKVLVFSQFVQMLNLLEKELDTRSIPYHMLTGRTVKREAVVQGFQQDPRASVFLLSLKAAGTGLNLTAASYVVLYDPWWNPAVEAQAIDRTHRIGQDRTVITYRLLARDTVEDKIYQLQQNKASMVKDILGEESFARALTKEDFNYLFSE